MPLVHGKDALRVETLCAAEQAVGVAAPASPAEPPLAKRPRGAGGRIADRDTAIELGRRGAEERWRKARQLKALTALGLRGVTPESLRPWLEDAEEFATAEVARLAREDGAGVCPQNAAVLVQNAALALAGSRASYAAGDLAAGAKLGVEVRQNLLAARELTVLEAKSRSAKANSADRWRLPATTEAKK